MRPGSIEETCVILYESRYIMFSWVECTKNGFLDFQNLWWHQTMEVFYLLLSNFSTCIFYIEYSSVYRDCLTFVTTTGYKTCYFTFTCGRVWMLMICLNTLPFYCHIVYIVSVNLVLLLCYLPFLDINVLLHDITSSKNGLHIPFTQSTYFKHII